MANLISTFRYGGANIPLYDDMEIIKVDSSSGNLTIKSGGVEYPLSGSAAEYFAGSLRNPEARGNLGIGRSSAELEMAGNLTKQYDEIKSQDATVKATESQAEKEALIASGKSPYTAEETISVAEYSAQKQQQLAGQETVTVEPKVEAQTAGTTTPSTSNQESNVTYGTTTFLTAQRNGFEGSYSDWVKAKRPSGAVTTGTTAESTTEKAVVEEPVTDTVDPNTGEPTISASTATSTNAATQNALAVLENSPFYQNLPEDQKALLRMTVKSWDSTKEVNMQNVLNEFEKIKTNTIDPQFEEQVDVFKKDVERAFSDLQINRSQEQEAE